MSELKELFAKKANENYWISGKCFIEDGDPFAAVEYKHTTRSIHICETMEELKERIGCGNWSIGQGFAYKNLCFTNQVNGGDEWLTMKYFADEDIVVAFESMTLEPSIERNCGDFEDTINRLLRATKDQCLKLEW